MAWLMTARSRAVGQPRLAAVLATACEVASGLAALHAVGVVHGDLSAYNVMLSSAGAGAAAGGRGFVAKMSPEHGCLWGRGCRSGAVCCWQAWLLHACAGVPAPLCHCCMPLLHAREQMRSALHTAPDAWPQPLTRRPLPPPAACRPRPCPLQVADFGISHTSASCCTQLPASRPALLRTRR